MGHGYGVQVVSKCVNWRERHDCIAGKAGGSVMAPGGVDRTLELSTHEGDYRDCRSRFGPWGPRERCRWLREMVQRAGLRRPLGSPKVVNGVAFTLGQDCPRSSAEGHSRLHERRSAKLSDARLIMEKARARASGQAQAIPEPGEHRSASQPTI